MDDRWNLQIANSSIGSESMNDYSFDSRELVTLPRMTSPFDLFNLYVEIYPIKIKITNEKAYLKYRSYLDKEWNGKDEEIVETFESVEYLIIRLSSFIVKDEEWGVLLAKVRSDLLYGASYFNNNHIKTEGLVLGPILNTPLSSKSNTTISDRLTELMLETRQKQLEYKSRREIEKLDWRSFLYE